MLVVLALVCGGLVAAVVWKTRSDAARTAQEAASYTPPPIASASPGTAAATVVIITDESASRASTGVTAAQRWPRLVADELGADTRTIAINGAGYATTGSRDRTFVDAAGNVPDDADLVVFVGGAADLGASSLSVGRAATRAFAAVKDQAPGAAVVAVGPLFEPSSASADDVDSLTAALASSARIADVDWVDPISAGWLNGVGTAAALDEQDESDIASRLEAVLDEALD